MFKIEKRIYLDNAASTPIDKNILRKMNYIFLNNYYNPSGLYKESLESRKIINKSRIKIAKTLNSSPEEIFFTQGGTEANNLAIIGLVNEWRRKSPEILPHIIISRIEHSSVSEVCKYLEENNLAEISRLSVDSKGFISSSELKLKIKNNTILVSVIYANNEIGVVQDIKGISKTIRWWKKHNQSEFPYFHSDAIQAVNYLNIDVKKLGLDFMSINASKIYGPKMIGVLFKKRNIEILPIIFGGGQEFKLRPGTENTPLIFGMAESLYITSKIKETEVSRLGKIQDYFFRLLKENIEDLIINGSVENRLVNNVHISIPNILDEELILRLGQKGILCSSKSACKNKNDSSSDTICAIGGECNYASIRFSMGRNTTKRDIKKTVKILKKILKKYK